MDINQKNVIIGHAQGEITEKKSRFIANVYEIHSEEQALQILDEVRKKYYDARHNCYAFVLGAGNELQRFSDDKEPQGTAGKPILEVLNKQNFRNTLIVVTRYFGGVLLGTGGLLRAYTQAALEGLRMARETGAAAALFEGVPMQIACDYSLSGKIQYIISQMEVPLDQVIYDTQVTFRVVVPAAQVSILENKITEAANAAALITKEEPSAFILSGTAPLPYFL